MRYFMFLVVSFCLVACNSTSSAQKTADATTKLSKPTSDQLEAADKAVFAGGCFWCTEAVFERVEGVYEVVSGYTAGDEPNPSYYDVGNGTTGHTEAIQIYYDASVVSYAQLVEVFFATHDPTQLNRQGPDVGTQYRSGAYYRTDEELAAIEAHIAYLKESGKYSQPIVTEVEALDVFYLAEGYHQDYYEQHPENPYVQRISKPKVDKFVKQFPQLLKAAYRK